MVGVCALLFVFLLPQAAALYVGGYVALGCLRWWAAFLSGITAAMLAAGLVGASGGLLMDLCGVPGQMFIGPPWAPLFGYVSMMIAFWPGLVAGLFSAVVVARWPVSAKASQPPGAPDEDSPTPPPDDRVRASSSGEYAERRSVPAGSDIDERRSFADWYRDRGRHVAPASWMLALLSPYCLVIGAAAIISGKEILPGMLQSYWGLTDWLAYAGGAALLLAGVLLGWAAYRMSSSAA